MTDGIIQKVFNKYYSYAMYMTERGYIERIEQELIEEIKKEFPDTWDWKNPIDNTWLTIHSRQLVKKMLIGDTQNE